MNDYTYEKCVANAAALLNLGNKVIYLSSGEYPWDQVVSCEPGGSHRLDISTSVWFRADDKSGLSFRWSFDIEPHDANGKGGYHIDIEGCRRVLERLPLDAKIEFQQYLADCAAKVRDKANEWRQAAEGQESTAAQLESIAARG